MRTAEWFLITFGLIYGYLMLCAGQTFDPWVDAFRTPMDEEPYEEI